jgi:hypothetical protein
MVTHEIAECHARDRQIQRTCRMVLHPLAQVVVRVFVAVGIGRRQLMVHILRDRKRSQDQQEQNQAKRQAGS